MATLAAAGWIGVPITADAEQQQAEFTRCPQEQLPPAALLRGTGGQASTPGEIKVRSGAHQTTLVEAHSPAISPAPAVSLKATQRLPVWKQQWDLPSPRAPRPPPA